MTSTSRLRRVVAPLVSAVATTAVLSGALWIQHARGGWPFSPREQAVAPRRHPRRSRRTWPAWTPSAMPDRVPVDVTPSMLQALGVRIEEVGARVVDPDHPGRRDRRAGRVAHLPRAHAGRWVGRAARRQHDRRDWCAPASRSPASSRRSCCRRRPSTWRLVAPPPPRASRAPSSPAGAHASPCSACRRRRSTEIEQTGEPKRLVTLVAPRSGVVVNRGDHGGHGRGSVDAAAHDCGPVARLGVGRGPGGGYRRHPRRQHGAPGVPRLWP